MSFVGVAKLSNDDLTERGYLEMWKRGKAYFMYVDRIGTLKGRAQIPMPLFSRTDETHMSHLFR